MPSKAKRWELLGFEAHGKDTACAGMSGRRDSPRRGCGWAFSGTDDNVNLHTQDVQRILRWRTNVSIHTHILWDDYRTNTVRQKAIVREAREKKTTFKGITVPQGWEKCQQVGKLQVADDTFHVLRERISWLTTVYPVQLYFKNNSKIEALSDKEEQRIYRQQTLIKGTSKGHISGRKKNTRSRCREE